MDILDLFYIKVSANRMHAHIYCTEAYEQDLIHIEEKHIVQLLTNKKITHGIDMKVISSIAQRLNKSNFPLEIATGTKPVHGKDGYITYMFAQETQTSEQQETGNFRDVMKIPTVQENEPIAKEILPTMGTPGKDVHGNIIRAQPGRKKRLRIGKNVRFDEDTLMYYATIEGQVSIRGELIEVHNVFTVNETLSMKTGNVDFVGSVEIHGDVPTGYRVKAGGDIRVFGFVEGATLIAEGSVYISEGFAGMQKGNITAAGDVHVAYVNQGTIQTEQSIYVETAILHSHCNAKLAIECKRGDIIGGSLIAGTSVVANDIGNRIHTSTSITITSEATMDDGVQRLNQRLSDVNKKIEQLDVIGLKFRQARNITEEVHNTIKRLNSSLAQLKREKTFLLQKIEKTKLELTHHTKAHIKAHRFLYPNVLIAFGKYQQMIERKYTRVQCRMESNELTIDPL